MITLDVFKCGKRISIYDKYKDEDFIIDAISEYVALDYLRAFNKGNNNPETIRAMRIALYKRLGEIINMIEAAK